MCRIKDRLTTTQVLTAQKTIIEVITKFYPSYPVEDISALAAEIVIALDEVIS